MGFKKRRLAKFNQYDKNVEIVVREGDGRKIDFLRVTNQAEFNKAVKIMEKYGYVNPLFSKKK